jgi:hypothetical protein
MLESQHRWYKPELRSLGWNIGCSYPFSPFKILPPPVTNLWIPPPPVLLIFSSHSLELDRRHRIHTMWRTGVWLCVQERRAISELAVYLLGQLGVLDRERSSMVRECEWCSMNFDGVVVFFFVLVSL